jgi:DNA-binding transcriptional regulator YiaG
MEQAYAYKTGTRERTNRRKIMRREDQRMTPKEMKNLRKAKGLTQIEVAIAVGVSVPAYRLWEAGGTKPAAENEKKLKEVLGGGLNAKAERAKN